MTATTDLSTTAGERLAKQLDRWRRELITLDRRQRLLYFKHTKSASLEIEMTDPSHLTDLVSEGPVLIRPRPEQSTELVGHADDSAAGRNDDSSLHVVGKTESELRSSLRRLDQVSQQTFADRGTWTLYLTVGILEWEDPQDRKPVLSPLLLLPVVLGRNGADQPYTVRRTHDEALVNPVLRFKLEEDFGVALPEVDPDDFEADDLLLDIQKVVAQHGWTVHDRSVLTSFSFHKEAIYKDLQENEQAIGESGLVQVLALGPDAPSAGTFGFAPPDDATLDDSTPPETLHNILDADGSQRKCIIAALDGKSFVMDGPPGTGKSQTIANMIAELMANGRSVLFVSEKIAALDVVRNRLAQVSLDSFVLELHSAATTRKHFSQVLGTALQNRVKAPPALSAADLNALATTRGRLSGYAAAMNELRPTFNRSIHWALGQISPLDRLAHLRAPADRRWSQLSDKRLAEIEEHAGALGRSWDPVTLGDRFMWRDVRVASGTADPARLRREVVGAHDAAGQLASLCEAVDHDLQVRLGRTSEAAGIRGSLLSVLEARPASADQAHLTARDLDGVSRRATVLREACSEHRAVIQELLSTIGTGWIQLEPDGLEQLAGITTPHDLWTVPSDLTASALAEAVDIAENLPLVIAEVLQDGRRLAAAFGVEPASLSLRRTEDLAALADLTMESALPESNWLNPVLAHAIEESQRVLTGLVSIVVANRDRMASTFTPEVLELDLVGLKTRFAGPNTGFGRFSSQARADRKTLRGVSVRGKVDKVLLSSLDDAVAWQQSASQLDRGEGEHGARLGSYYQRTDTDFERLGRALGVAQRAVQLAGDDLDPTVLGRQLSTERVADPSIPSTARRLRSSQSSFAEGARRAFGDAAASRLSELPLTAVADLLVDLTSRLRPRLTLLQEIAAVAGANLTVASACTALERAGAASDAEAEVLNSYADDRLDLGAAYTGLDTDWDALESALEWAEKVRALVGTSVSPASADRFFSPTLASTDLAPTLTRWVTARDRLVSSFAPSRGTDLLADLDSDLDEASMLLDDMVKTSTTEIDTWLRFTESVDWLENNELRELVDEMAREKTPSDQVALVVRRAVIEAWVDAVSAEDRRLSDYRPDDRDALVSRFRELDERLVSQSNGAVIAACNQRRPVSDSSRGAQVIRRQAELKSRHKAIRQVLTEAGDVAIALKPCFMMSPLAVSQYLPSDMRFDVVIFDEASQVLPSDAINCIYRARQLIVAGDQKQLPPTSFFASAASEEEDDDEALADFSSVLDLCKGSGGLPSLPLSWHYRSDHEDLIAFSNYRFYRGELFTFPSAQRTGADVGVESFVVDGTYRRGTTRDNPVEAAAIADRVILHATQHPELSVGVVTFSGAQEDAILAELERRSVDHPEVSRLLSSHDRLDGFFVKSLENVQGDERDIILFSIGYGPDEAGKMTNNFGPLNKEGGWKRLNVAITRARRRVEVISSFRPGAIQSSNDSVVALARYLDFADRGVQALALESAESLGEPESPFEEDVIREIQAMGYDVVPQVGTAGYRIDIGVVHPTEPGRFILAVECDGAAYHSSKVARDRDRLREGVLTRLGWTVFRIWGLSWARDRRTQVERLRRALAEATDAREAPRPVLLARDVVQVEIETVDLSAPPAWAVAYEPADVWPSYEHDQWHEPEARPALRRATEDFLSVEAPVHRDLLDAALRQVMDIGRIGARIRSNIDAALDAARVDGARVSTDGAGFIRVSGAELPSPRVPGAVGQARKIRHVPPEELDLAVVGLVQDAIAIEGDDLRRAVSQLFGWNLTGEAVSAIESATSRVVHRGDVLLAGRSYRKP
ncbi:hypothetical protein Sked_24040 [Sanguibacter keddieii DSM 10542]|uniref:AAA domain-containing protein n=1 Tax=Sanguibacter keddieii (strain ATCC 51767 / DSM 10542 / NCFB 3025 / ST-74) TaxID=446469 RepID=D1BJC4_SANKS|nr:DUF3320 domain-containing protein [Sanguibacter keddieii]ACZ22318.1 hypothetical protein Sked_24040 [Sanguibacter keddieii DSM 10542]